MKVDDPNGIILVQHQRTWQCDDSEAHRDIVTSLRIARLLSPFADSENGLNDASISCTVMVDGANQFSLRYVWGIILISVPQLLSIRHVPETTIAAMSAVMASPGIWTFLVSPVLDVRFSRRWYSVVSAAMAAVLLVVALLNLDHLALVEVLLVAGYFFANLYQSALGGWLSSITSTEQENKLSSWVTIGNLGAGGAMAVATGELIRTYLQGLQHSCLAE
jgi:MFS transporter, PAT family, beta-lactamase induction signal transducer AmpG